MTNASPRVPSCMNCRFFRPPPTGENDLIEQGMGHCLRYPPKTETIMVGWDEREERVSADTQETKTIRVPQLHRILQPTIMPMSGWCGEHQKTQMQLPPTSAQRKATDHE